MDTQIIKKYIFLKNIDIGKEIYENIAKDIDKILYRQGFGISNSTPLGVGRCWAGRKGIEGTSVKNILCGGREEGV